MAAIKSSSLEILQLEENATQTLYFKLTPKLTGRLSIIGMVANVASAAEPHNTLIGSLQFETQTFRPPGKQSNQSLFDQKLNIRVIPAVPWLNVSFSATPKDLIAGEILPITISLRNEGIKPIEEVFLGCDNPRWLTLQDKDADIPLSILSSIKNLSNEKLVKDKEIRKQHVFRLLKNRTTEKVALEAQECITITAWLQAPFDKGEHNLRLLFYYALPSTGSNLKFRLVRHNWKFTIHECLHTEVSCVLSNAVTCELGINVDVRNENKLHHPLMSELYINSLALYCDKFKLNKDKLYLMNQMEISSGLLGERCLKSTKTASFQCRLIKSKKSQTFQPPAQEVLKSRLSCMDIMPMKTVSPHQPEQNIPKISEMYSFLANHETIYFNTNITTEDFNNIVAAYEPHTTLIICWSAAIVQNSVQRLAYGQHFVQLQNLYEKKSCPITSELKQFKNIDKDHEKILSIEEFATKKQQEVTAALDDKNVKFELLQTFDDDEDDFWEPNDCYVGQRCLLEDETFLVATKA